MHPAKIQIRLRKCSGASLGAFLIAKGVKFNHTDIEISNQTARTRRLICLIWAKISEGMFYDDAAIAND